MVDITDIISELAVINASLIIFIAQKKSMDSKDLLSLHLQLDKLIKKFITLK